MTFLNRTIALVAVALTAETVHAGAGLIRGNSRVQVDGLVASVEVGRQLFQANCVRCHGPNASGGPIGRGTRPEAPDLTTFALRNGGVFPSERVKRIIDGREIASHMMREMPVWGDVFRTTAGGASPAQVAARIESLTAYLESIQLRRGE